MPLHGQHHSSSPSPQYDDPTSQPGTASGTYQAAQTVDSIGASGNESTYPSSGKVVDFGSGVQTAPPIASGLPGPDPSALASNSTHLFETPRRAQTINRQSEELHIPPAGSAMSGQQSRDPSQHYSYHSSQDITGRGPGISVHQATPQGSQHPASSSGMSLPGPLQSGRPGPSSANTAPSTIPTLPQTLTHPHRYSSPSRSSISNHSHNYSRSSPVGLDQHKYIPFVNTPENSKFVSPTSQKHISQTPLSGASYSPLGLADIRPRADSGLSDGPLSANPYTNEGLPTNSNYLAPWAVYAFDWCKWPVQQQSGDAAGKMAIGSYVEDGHNFVSTEFAIVHSRQTTGLYNRLTT